MNDLTQLGWGAIFGILIGFVAAMIMVSVHPMYITASDIGGDSVLKCDSFQKSTLNENVYICYRDYSKDVYIKKITKQFGTDFEEFE